MSGMDITMNNQIITTEKTSREHAATLELRSDELKQEQFMKRS
jgi:hypothetical protein